MSSSVRITLFSCVAILLTAFILFYPSLRYDFHNVDDYENIVTNGDIRQINLKSISAWFTSEYILMYIPVTIASFAIDYQIWRLNPFGFHLTNLLLHLATVCFCYFVVFRVTKDRFVTFLATLMFAIHPVQTESVVWITERKNILSTFFFLLSMLTFVNRRFWSTLILFALALLSKPNMIVFPAIFFAYEFLFGSNFSRRKQIGFYLILSLICGAVGAYMFYINLRSELNIHGGSFGSNYVIALSLFLRYFKLLLFPYHQQAYYMTKLFSSWTDPQVVWSVVSVLFSFLGILYVRKRNPGIAFFGFWYFLGLLPTAHFLFPVTSLMHDRYLYIPIIGFFAVVGCLLKMLIERLHFADFFNRCFWVVCIGLFAIPYYAIATDRIGDWRDSIHFWQQEILRAEYPDPRPHINLASALGVNGQQDKSIPVIDNAYQTFGAQEALFRQAQNMMATNHIEKAKEYLDQMAPSEDLLADLWKGAYLDLKGIYFMSTGDYAQAEKFFREALVAKKRIPSYAHLADLLYGTGRADEAIQVMKDALEFDPDAENALVRICAFYIGKRDYDTAYPYYTKLARLYPKNPYVAHIQRQMAKETQKSQLSTLKADSN